MFGDGEGIVDGWHTYELIMAHLDDDRLPEDQYVKFEILTNVPSDWIAEISGGLNTSVQVQPMSLDNLSGKFDWIKNELADEPYAGDIAWRENDKGELDARDIVSILACFNIDLFSPTDAPIEAYSRKSKVLESFEKHPDSYKKLRPILRDILRLHDTISCDAREVWNAGDGERKGRLGRFAFVEEARREDFRFPFTGSTSKYRLLGAALYPMLAAFRCMVETDPQASEFRWRGGFQNVLDRWESTAFEMIQATVDTYESMRRNPTVMGKSRSLWTNLYNLVALRELQKSKI
jgi:hypothetical protein